ncbi:MAG: hypothetical protein AAGA81_06325 [Acidobacteriota bacterium]
MKSFLAPVALSLAALAPASAAVNNDSDTLSWTKSYDEALQEAKETGKPLFLEFRCAP